MHIEERRYAETAREFGETETGEYEAESER